MKNFVLDTNVLIHDPYSIFEFEDNRVIILNSVQTELDQLKKHKPAAREVINILEGLIDNALEQFDFDELNGVWLNGFLDIPLESGGYISIEQAIEGETYADKHILQWVKEYNQSPKALEEGKAIIVSKDKAVRNKGKINGFTAEDYVTDRVQDVYTGFKELFVTADVIDTFYATKSAIVLPEGITKEPVYPNEIVHLKAYENEKKAALGIYQNGLLQPLHSYPELRIKPLNREQHCALSMLFDPTISCVMISGEAGTGKTLLAILAGFEQTINGQYESLIITCGMQPLGKDIGYLPGEKEEKVRPWINPILDNLRVIFQKKDEYLTNDDVLERLRELVDVEIEPLTYIRGRTFHRKFIIVDEAQNLTPHETKAILTRVGQGSKIVLVGDPSDNQIDNVYLSSRSNGLVYCLDRLKTSKHTAAIALPRNERSELSRDVSKLL
jgi:PhoH-like ATPase